MCVCVCVCVCACVCLCIFILCALLFPSRGGTTWASNSTFKTDWADLTDWMPLPTSNLIEKVSPNTEALSARSQSLKMSLCEYILIINEHSQKLISILENQRGFLKYWYFGFHFPEPIYKVNFYSTYWYLLGLSNIKPKGNVKVLLSERNGKSL